MDKAQKDIITANRVELVETITVKDGLYSQLIQKKLFSQRTVNRIKSAGADEQQVEELLNEIVKRDCFDLFCQALIDDTQSDVVKKYLKPSTSQVPPNNPLPSTDTANSTENVATPQPAMNIPPNPHQSLESTPSITTDCVSGTKRANVLPPFTLSSNTAMLCFRENDNQSITIQYNQTPIKKPRQDDSVTFENDETRYHLKHYLSGGLLSDAVQAVNNPQSLSNPNIADPQRYAAAFIQEPSRLLETAQVHLSHPTDSNIIVSEARNVTDIKKFRNLLRPQNTLSLNTTNSLNITNMDSNQRNNLKRMDHNSSSRTVRLGQVGEMSFQKIMPVQETGGGSDSNYDSVDNVSLPNNTMLNFDKERMLLRATQPSGIINIMPDYYGENHQVSADFEDDMNSIDLPDGCVNVKVEHSTKDFFKHNFKKSYPMGKIPRGLALIINVDQVEGKPPRKGTNFDRDNLCSLLTQLHFNILVYNDKDGLTALDIVNKLKAFSRLKEHEACDACFICILSHGEEGYIFGTDGKRIPLEEIFMLFANTNCKGLIGKPKIFIIQACRGGYLDKGVPLDEPDGGPSGPVTSRAGTQLPSMSDMLICYPTQAGYYAWRNRARGSWFIEAIVQVFMRYAKNEDICAMLNRVNYLVSRKVSESNQKEMHNMSQMSEYKSTLRKPHLFFFPGMCVALNQEM